MWSIRFFAALLAVSVVFATVAGAEPTEVGTTAATNTDTTGTPPRMATRNLFIGTNVFFEERIETSKTGQAQLLFLDESALTIASNSDVVLDKFIYDPKTSKGELALSVGSGLFRFVGGRISKTSMVTIKTPTATIGIRGGIIIIKVDPRTRATRAIFVFGKEMTVTNDSGVIRKVTRPSFAVDVASKDEEPSSPQKVSGNEMAGHLTELEGRTGQTAGLTEILTDEQIADSGCCPAVDPGEIVGGPTAGTGGTDGGTDGGTLPPEVPECCDFTETNPIPSPSRTLTGFSGGVFTAVDFDEFGNITFTDTGVFANTSGDPADIQIVTEVVGGTTSNGTVTATFDVQEIDAVGNDSRLVAEFGGTGVSEFVDNTKFRIDDPAASATLDGDPLDVAIFVLATNDLVALPAGDFCECQFLQWGLWTAHLEDTPSVDLETADLLAFWVAGELPALLDMPTTGTATYSGHAIGAVIDEAGVHQAVGDFSQTYNFATNSGMVDITSFDGANFVDIPVTGSGAGFTGMGEDTTEGLDIELNGAFFSGGGDPVAQVGGGFSINGIFDASGIFAADKQ